ncbi:MAG: anthrone oxygenase family protein, partial [Candidatus Poseidoniaceae archaeon]
LAFKHMDEVIQNNQPLFVLVWAGSILSVILTLALGIMNLDDEKLYLLIGAASVYLIGVQLPTFRFNIPLNNELQNLDIEDLEETQAKTSRTKFETSWNRWNRIRTINGIVAVSMFLLLLYFL